MSDMALLISNAAKAVVALDNWTTQNEANWTAWGDMIVPPGAEWMRIKTGQAMAALLELPGFREAVDVEYARLSGEPEDTP